MKRCIFCLAAAIILIMLAACSGQEPVLPAEESQSSSILEASAVSGEELTNKAIERIQERVINNLTTEDMLVRLKNRGITVSIENLKKRDNIYCFDLCLIKDDGTKLLLPVNELSCEHVVTNFDMPWGGISIIDENTIAISTFKEMRFYDAETLKELPLQLDLSTFQGNDYYLLGVVRDMTEGIIVPVFYNGVDGFAFFRGDGTLNRIETFEYGTPESRWFYSDERSARYQDKLEVIRLDDTYIMFSNSRAISSVLYSISKKQVMGQFYPKFDTQDGNRRIILSVLDVWGNFRNNMGQNNAMALYYENDSFVCGFFFNRDEISPSFGEPNVEDYPGLQYQWHPTKPIVSASCDFCDLTITLDFEKNSSKLEYKIKPEHLEEVFATSSDGIYSLYRASSDGGGDVIYSNVVLKDNQTGDLRFITLFGGMYGGYSDIGFFNNGEIYALKLDSLRIYSLDPAVPSPLLTFKMPLGYLEKEQVYRYLFTFRRDPVTKEFIILYGEIPIDAELKGDAAPYEYPCNYKIGLCDKDGNLLTSFDTGQPVLIDHFGYIKMYFYLSGDELTVTGANSKGFIEMQGVFNLKSHSYKKTPVNDGRSIWATK